MSLSLKIGHTNGQQLVTQMDDLVALCIQKIILQIKIFEKSIYKYAFLLKFFFLAKKLKRTQSLKVHKFI